jgi:hypothetical protein
VHNDAGRKPTMRDRALSPNECRAIKPNKGTKANDADD